MIIAPDIPKPSIFGFTLPIMALTGALLGYVVGTSKGEVAAGIAGGAVAAVVLGFALAVFVPQRAAGRAAAAVAFAVIGAALGGIAGGPDEPGSPPNNAGIISCAAAQFAIPELQTRVWGVIVPLEIKAGTSASLT